MLKVVGATVSLLALLILGVWTLPASHDRGDLTGTWRFRVRLSDTGRSTVRFVLRQDGEVSGQGTWTAERANSVWDF